MLVWLNLIHLPYCTDEIFPGVAPGKQNTQCLCGFSVVSRLTRFFFKGLIRLSLAGAKVLFYTCRHRFVARGLYGAGAPSLST